MLNVVYIWLIMTILLLISYVVRQYSIRIVMIFYDGKYVKLIKHLIARLDCLLFFGDLLRVN
jgi:hypothetical protein